MFPQPKLPKRLAKCCSTFYLKAYFEIGDVSIFQRRAGDARQRTPTVYACRGTSQDKFQSAAARNDLDSGVEKWYSLDER